MAEADKNTLAKAYDPKTVEHLWYKRWLDRKYFHAEIDPAKIPYSIVIPPPNVTGSLHIGHAFNNTLQDIVIRKKRMEGRVALWLPGTDHAGIATQNVVERELAKEGLTRQDIGRDKFVERVWEWKAKYGETIIDQLKKLGCSCDWDRERFTMDEEYSRAVRVVFKKLYDEGLVYRGSYIINWCPRCITALSDIEVEHEDKQGKLWYIRYPLKECKPKTENRKPENGKRETKAEQEYIVVATTRPETMLGDTAVAVNPEDKRYKNLVGATVVLPLLNREIPIIADDFVDPAFGTGAVKVTPSHDPNDFEIGLRHDLEQVNIFTEEAALNKNAGPYEGLDRYEGREAVLKDLAKGAYLVKDEDHAHAVGHCYRCHTVVEPYQSLQWFVKMKPLAGPAIMAVRNGDVKFHPKRWEKTYFEWMENIRDWCISRQLWWGHRIPVWYCGGCGETVVAVDDPTVCPKCAGNDLKQDEDVLDTWFSSWLWPFATMGWPDNTTDLEFFYPTSLLSTAFDIIFFWVARMIMAGLYFMDEIPFNDVYVHALIRDAQGQKMSKSSGNVIDPLDVIEWSGTDALRFTLASLAVPGRDVILSEDRIEGYRHFVNKLWNASRFVLMNLDGYDPAFGPRKEDLTVADRWILSRLTEVIAETNKYLEAYNFSEACRSMYSYIWGDYCDWYIEWSKQRLNGEGRAVVQYVLVRVLETTLRLLHPIMPFVTEEIWQKIPGTGETIMLAEWPKSDKSNLDTEAKSEANYIIDLVNAIREAKQTAGIKRQQELKFEVFYSEEKAIQYLDRNTRDILMLAKVNATGIHTQPIENMATAIKATEYKNAIKVVTSSLVCFLMPKGNFEIDTASQIQRLGRQLNVIDADLAKAKGKLANEGFLTKAAPDVVNKVKKAAADLEEKQEKLRHQLELLDG